jgi:hypothetical protein
MVSDARWLAQFGYRVARGGYLIELEVSHLADWLAAYLAKRGGTAGGGEVAAAAAAAGWNYSTLKRARRLLCVSVVRTGNPGGGRASVWSVPGADQLSRLRAKERRYRQRHREELAARQRRRHWANRDAELKRKAVYRAAQRAAG